MFKPLSQLYVQSRFRSRKTFFRLRLQLSKIFRLQLFKILRFQLHSSYSKFYDSDSDFKIFKKTTPTPACLKKRLRPKTCDFTTYSRLRQLQHIEKTTLTRPSLKNDFDSSLKHATLATTTLQPYVPVFLTLCAAGDFQVCRETFKKH